MKRTDTELSSTESGSHMQWRSGASQTVMVVSNATKGPSMGALDWALRHVVRPGDDLILVGVLHEVNKPLGYKSKGDSKFLNKANRNILKQEICKVKDIYANAVEETYKSCEKKGVHFEIDIKFGPLKKVIVEEASDRRASWVILDRTMKKHKKFFSESILSNIILMKRNDEIETLRIQSRVVGASSESSEEMTVNTSLIISPMAATPASNPIQKHNKETPRTLHDVTAKAKAIFLEEIQISGDTTVGLPQPPQKESLHHDLIAKESMDEGATSIESDASSITESSFGSSAPSLSYTNSSLSPDILEKEAHDISECRALQGMSGRLDHLSIVEHSGLDSSSTTTASLSCDQSLEFSPIVSRILTTTGDSEPQTSISSDTSQIFNQHPISVRPIRIAEAQLLGELLDREVFPEEIQQPTQDKLECGKDSNYHRSNSQLQVSKQETALEVEVPAFQCTVQDPGKEKRLKNKFSQDLSISGMLLSMKRRMEEPLLCSVCRQKSPSFGQPPQRFAYSELQNATENFSPENFLAEGGYGCVYKGILHDGQVVAVKQHKLASSQGAAEFCSEVKVLSGAQHRNLVTLIGYCIEKQMLVYEYICNKSLDWHLSSQNPNILEWPARQKIAVGSARGLRYLHEECRVGCIIHRDMRPHNILLTHDFVPMVGDFGLARWQATVEVGIKTHPIGPLGYMAPEYLECGKITDKADVYSFGVVLLELITGRKAMDTSLSTKDGRCLTEWARPLLEERKTHELLDPRLEDSIDDYELYCMVSAASLCLRKNPALRPQMSQVLRVLEGEEKDAESLTPTESVHGLAQYYDENGSKSGEMYCEQRALVLASQHVRNRHVNTTQPLGETSTLRGKYQKPPVAMVAREMGSKKGVVKLSCMTMLHH